MAASLGYPYLRGEGRTAGNGRTWLSRVTKASDGSGPAIFVGWDSIKHEWVIEKESGHPYERGPRIGRGGNPEGSQYIRRSLHHQLEEAAREQGEKIKVVYVEGPGENRNKYEYRGKLYTPGELADLLGVRWPNPDEFVCPRCGDIFTAAEIEAGKLRKHLAAHRAKRAKSGNPFDWREQREQTGTIIDSIRHGDRVTIVDRFGKSHSGKAVMRGPAGWVLNMGGAHGTPGIATAENIVKVRKSNPAKPPRPRKRESVPDYHARRVAAILRKMPKPIRDVFDRNPSTYKFIFRNPEDESQLEAAEDLYKTFHGREPREILEMQESSETRGEYTALGDLVELTFIAPNGDHVLVKFTDDGVRVASSPSGEQLYFLGGNQDISGSLKQFGADEEKDLIDLGELKQIVYEASKWQTDFTAQEWKHDLGEESGVKPRGFFDQLKKRIFIAGGNYKVKRPGIID